MTEIEKPKSDQKPKRISKGRTRIPIALIENKASRQVSFSKRRGGLFKKAGELCSLCGAEVAVVVFSGAGKLYSFGHPTADDVILRYLISSSPEGKEVISRISAAETKKKPTEFWWNEPIDEGLGLEELEQLKVSIEGLGNRVFSRLSEINNNNNTNNYINSSLVYYDVNNNNNNYNYNNDQQNIDFGSMNNSNNYWNNNYEHGSSSSWHGVR